MATERLRTLHAMATRRATSPDEADDLVQDVLLAATEQGRTLDDPQFTAWAAGVLRRRALFVARTAGRRRRREAAYAAEDAPAFEATRKLPASFVEALPPSLQVVALLANAGLGRAEIAHLLRLPDTALRQRISGLRKAWHRTGMTPAEPDVAILKAGNGPRRRALKAGLVKLPQGHLAVADPDGHPIFLSDGAHKPAGDGN